MQGQGTPWASTLRGFDGWDDDRKRSIATSFLTALGQHMQGAQIVPKPKDDEIQLRGVYAGYPTRVIVDPFFSFLIDMKAPNRQPRSLSVKFDPESAPSPGDDDAWDESEEVRVFLARCVYVEEAADEIGATLELVESLPMDFRQHLFQIMQARELASFGLSGDGPGAAFHGDLGSMPDPMLQLVQGLWIVAYGANVYGALPPPAGQGAQGGGVEGRPRCRYCGTVFLLGPTSTCPNCGAAFTG